MPPNRHTQQQYASTLGDESDDDLPLEELDPINTEHGSLEPRIQDSAGWEGGDSYTSLQIQKLRLGGLRRTHTPQSQDHEDDVALGLLDDQEDSERAHELLEIDEDRPFLRSNGGNTEDHHQPLSSDQRIRSRRRSSVHNILAKLRSTPQSLIAEDCDSTNSRAIEVGRRQQVRFPQNIVSNAKYTAWSFLPRTLYHEFSFFLNLYFLFVALSQIIPPLRIGYWSTYIAPLVFVLFITLGKEAYDDITRRKRDAEANSERYTVLDFGQRSRSKASRRKAERQPETSCSQVHEFEGGGEEVRADGSSKRQLSKPTEFTKASKDLKVGDVMKLSKDQRVPADAIILKTVSNETVTAQNSEGGEAFIRTDQLDGETDWKLRLAPQLTQMLDPENFQYLVVRAGQPEKKVNEFVGSLSISPRMTEAGSESNEMTSSSLTIDNTAWANTVLASNGHAYAVVVYTGPQTRQAMSTSSSRTKTGLLELEINSLTKILCFLTLLLSLLLVALEKAETQSTQKWYIAVMRYLILFSTIVPISLRVNLDLGKAVYAWFIHRDADIPGTVVRSSTIPEDLGRIEYLLSDKTGTLTQNEMQLKKIHVGTVSYANDSMSEVSAYLRQGYGDAHGDSNTSAASITRSRREIGSRVRDLVLALAICHNVTPTFSDDGADSTVTYQASSPDEIAIVRWTEAVGLKLIHRDRYRMVLELIQPKIQIQVEILHVFPFTSEGKRMGIIVRLSDLGEQGQSIWFFQKGADTVMSTIVAANDWLDEETANMAREGLRTLVVGRKRLSSPQYQNFSTDYKAASLKLQNRDALMSKVVAQYLEQNLELLGVTGVEDKLQRDVKPSLELLRNAGVKIWMLTGDKVETARCVAVSSKLVARGQYVHTISRVKNKDAAGDSLSVLQSKTDACLLIDGESLALMLLYHRDAFIHTAIRLPCVVACRCSPLQKAEIAQLIKVTTRKRVCCIGDGGNDVSMIQAADVGVGIVGKEGRQASLAADFSITQFCHLTKLLMWHGRNSYKRSAKLGQFVIHRGLIISICQTVFSVARRFQPDALYRDWLLVGYATIYTMMPVFSLVLDTDIPPQLAHLYPELYAELSSSRSLSYRTFFLWTAVSVYQGCALQLCAMLLVFGFHFSSSSASPSSSTATGQDDRMVFVGFTALILNELAMVAGSITTWHWINAISILGTALCYFGSIPLLSEYFDLNWLRTLGPWWRIGVAWAVSFIPVAVVYITIERWRPPNYLKIRNVV